MTTVVGDIALRAANQKGRCDVTSDRVVFDLAAIRGARAGAIDEGDLHPYVDAALEAGRRAMIEAQLARDPQLRLAALACRVINVDLHRLFDHELPPLTAALERLSRELERRIGRRTARHAQIRYWSAKARQAFFSLRRRDAWRSIMRTTERRDAYADRKTAGALVDWVATAIDRAPLLSIVAVATLITLGGMTWPALINPVPSCSERVEAVAKSVARVRGAPELGQRLAAAGLLCEAGDSARAEGLLAQVGEDARRLGY